MPDNSNRNIASSQRTNETQNVGHISTEQEGKNIRGGNEVAHFSEISIQESNDSQNRSDTIQPAPIPISMPKIDQELENSAGENTANAEKPSKKKCDEPRPKS